MAKEHLPQTYESQIHDFLAEGLSTLGTTISNADPITRAAVGFAVSYELFNNIGGPEFAAYGVSTLCMAGIVKAILDMVETKGRMDASSNERNAEDAIGSGMQDFAVEASGETTSDS